MTARRCARYSLTLRSPMRSSFVFVGDRAFVERFQLQLAVLIFHQQLDFLLDLGELLVADFDQSDAVFERRQRIFERELARFQAFDDFLEILDRLFEFLLFLFRLHRSPEGCYRFVPIASRSSGSIRAVPSLAPQWRCGPVTRPVMPARPMRSPLCTASPTATRNSDRWKYIVYSPPP